MTVLGHEHRQDREILFPLRLDDAIMTTDMPWAQALRDTRHIADWARCLDNKESYWQELARIISHLTKPLSGPPFMQTKKK